MKKRFNIIDITVILVVTAVVIAGAFVLGDRPAPSQSNARVVTVEVREKTAEFCKVPQSGDILIDSVTKTHLGKLISKETKKASGDLTSLEDGKIVKSEMPDRYDLYLTIEMNSPDTVPKIGTLVSIQGRTYTCSGFVVEMPENQEVSK